MVSVDRNNDYEVRTTDQVSWINIQDSSCKLEDGREDVSSFIAQSEAPRVLKDIGGFTE